MAGIYRDYSNSQGTVMMALDLYRRYWDDPAVTAALMVLKPGEDPDANVRGLQDALAGIQGVTVRPNPALRAEALAVFDRAFAITGALQLLAALVAFIGILSALLSLQLERGRELGLMRAVGPDRPPAPRAGAAGDRADGAGRGAAGDADRPGAGLGLDLHHQPPLVRLDDAAPADPGIFLQALALAVGAALLAGVYPAWRMGRMAAAEALRGE